MLRTACTWYSSAGRSARESIGNEAAVASTIARSPGARAGASTPSVRAAVRPVHDEAPSIRELPLEALSDAFWSADLEPLSGIAMPGVPAPPAQLLFRCGYRYAFPLTVRDRRLGFLAASYRLGETPLSSEAQDPVRQLLNQAALAIENAYLLDQLQRQLAGLQ